MITRTVDSRGRLTLGSAFADKTVIIHELAGQVLQIVPAEVVPAREAWLYKNGAAIGAVMQGLDEAKAGTFAEPPDLESGSALADMIQD